LFAAFGNEPLDRGKVRIAIAAILTLDRKSVV
jgi:hypothetical protein